MLEQGIAEKIKLGETVDITGSEKGVDQEIIRVRGLLKSLKLTRSIGSSDVYHGGTYIMKVYVPTVDELRRDDVIKILKESTLTFNLANNVPA